MEANEMRAKFLLQYEAARLGNRTFNDREIADFLNKAQIQLVKTRFDALKNRTQRGFGDSAIRQAEIDGLLSATVTLSNDSFIQGTKYNGALRNNNRSSGYTDDTQAPQFYGVFVQLPDEVLYMVNESVTTADNIDISSATLPVKDNVPVEEVNYLEYKSRIYDPYAQPYDNLVWSMGYGNWMPSTYAVTTGGTRTSPGNVAITDSTKNYTQQAQSGIIHNIWGISATTWDGTNSTGDPNTDVPLDTAEWIAFDARRSRYLLSWGQRNTPWYVVEYQGHYIKTPPDIYIDVVSPTLQVNCTLAEFLHQEIVDLSVKLASAAIVPENGKYQVNDVETKINE